jgi:hypothetical protein
MSDSRWRFSVRSLLVLTTILSLVLAFVVTWPDVCLYLLILSAPVLVLAAILKSANFLTSERRPRVAMLSWIMLCGFFAFYAFGLLSVLFQPGGGGVDGPLLGVAIMSACWLACAVRAYRAYQLIGVLEPGASVEPQQGPTPGAPAESQKE